MNLFLSNFSWNLLLFAQVIGLFMLSPPKSNSSSLDSPLSGLERGNADDQ